MLPAIALVFITVVDAPSDSLSFRLIPLLQAHQGEVAVAVKHLQTGETFFHRADLPMPMSRTTSGASCSGAVWKRGTAAMARVLV